MKIARVMICMLLAGFASAQPPLRLKGLQRGPPGPHPSKRHHMGRKHWIVQFAAQPTPAQLLNLTDRGARILSYVPDFGYSISAPSDVRFDDVAWAGQLQAANKLSANLSSSLVGDIASKYVVVEFYSDVELDDARAIVQEQNLQVVDNPNLIDHQFLVYGSLDDIAALGGWDEVSYIFPAADELVGGLPMLGCVGALTTQGLVGQSIPTFGEGWDGPGLGSARLNYAFINQTSKLPADQVASEVARAFAEWAKYVKVTFTPTSDPNATNTIGIMFGTGNHGDAYPFVGLAVVAHTFYPYPTNPETIAGDMHFNADQNWGIGFGSDVFSVALHEAGHALGLGHSDLPGSVMYPYYRVNIGLTPEDIAAIQGLYAAQNATSPPVVVSQFVLNALAPPSATTNTSVTIQGTTTGGSGAILVSWMTNNGLSGVAAGSASWTAGPIPLSVGVNTITITAQDATSARASQVFTITRQSTLSTPQLSIVNPCSSACTATSPSVSVSGTASDASGISRVTWSSLSGSSGQALGTLTWNTGPLTLLTGINTLTITAYAQSSATVNHSVQLTYLPQPTAVDTSAPTLTILSPALTTLTTTAASIAFSGTTRDPVGVTAVTWANSNGGSGTAAGTANWNVPFIPLLVGTNTITIRATNVGNFVAWRSVIVTRR